MEYHEAADFLFDLRRFRPKPGTESTARLLAHLGDPHDGVEFVQIAGSNGKGSTARMVERSLREAGLSVGLYTSPHLEDLRERIRVDGRKIPRSAVREFVEAAHEYLTDRGADGESPTFFETMTAMAVWQFGREDVDVAVLEVGIGGKYDATSVVDPVASAVTSVTLEHTGILGDTVGEIARDKAHVAPADAPLVTGTTGDALEGVREVAGDVITVGAADADRDDEPDVRVAYGGRVNHTEAAVTVEHGDWTLENRLSLLGAHQAENAGIAAVLARQVADISDDDLARGLRSAHWPGRFEVLETTPLIVLDGAHNPGACEPLAATLDTYDYDDLHLVFGAMHDKDHREMAATLPTPDVVVATEPPLDRAEDRDVLASVFEDVGVADVRTSATVQDALETALREADDNDCVLVTGSLFAVAEARSRWTNAGVPKRIRDREDAREALSTANVPAASDSELQGDAVHRVVSLSLGYRRATAVERELLRLGGECALSGLQRDEESVDAVLMGTVTQFERLVERLESGPGPTDRSDDGTRGLLEVARELRERLEIDSEADSSDGPTAVTAGTTGADGADAGHPWDDRTAVMGILNVTPDSFHDGGEYDALEDAVARAERMIENGVDVIDVGGESTRPGADPVPTEAEIDRVVPVVEEIADLDALVSIDTRKAAVAEAALEAGADIINDVSGLEDPEMRFVVADHDAMLVLMHSIDAPVVPGREIEYDDVVEDVIDRLSERILLAEKAGIDREDIIVDPGIGFGKSAPEAFELLDRTDEFRALGCPILIGHSHKSMFEHVGRETGERTAATVAASAIAADRGADIVRVHDVPENVAAVRTALAARNPERFDWQP
ncbi:dihydropteroate synthase [Haloterrigena turkmenica DSM 5511]|uniref:Probable bifunctional folylpolyglutamate synthase/dihydropteroate synthase n=1 Tax=Haloterrigena turkmenica (strain ATCC 51198 / DSM 5511 / JCM 9101 / NCIMB 13204 / VKM B-1734 / 4k) TaxID=543526 RepID=D2RPJ6_HALTV|nr:dihydropteroate synthase [Haloterrigena turkmenica]ADB62148.1 dihydropteroate synthase [Haloterrigena turkmenica DSM 5511]